MRRILVDYAEPGMIVARSVFNSDGKVLLASGMKLKSSFIWRIKKLGIGSIYIQDDIDEDLEVPDIISEHTRVAVTKTVKSVFTEMKIPSTASLKPLQSTINLIVDEVLQNRNILVNLTDVRCYDDYTFGHSVNVGLMAILTGLSMGYNYRQLRDIGVGAILHDLGKTKIDLEIINKPGKLTDQEFSEVQKHSEYGFNILRQMQEIPLMAAHVSFQHHERFDGSGYPRKLKGKDIQEYARIVAVADVYDALLADRPYRRGYPPHKALEIMSLGSNTQFDPDVFTAFLDNIAVYPVGTVVQLNTGEIGIVTHVDRGLQIKPTVRVLYSNTGERVTDRQEIELGKRETVHIYRVYNEGLSQSLLKNYTAH